MAADVSLPDDIVENRSGSSSMDVDVAIRGDIVEFLNKQRCEACQSRERDCIIRFGKDACLLCSDAEEPCVFERLMRVRGPAAKFSWGSLLGEESLLGVADGSSSINDT